MASTRRVLPSFCNVNLAVLEHSEAFLDDRQQKHVRLHFRPYKRLQCLCPYCHQKCPVYDHPSHPRRWRDLDASDGTIMEIESDSVRVHCPVHGVVAEEVPWAYPHSRFTRAFDSMVTWLAKQTPFSVIAHLMRIDWASIGRCVKRVTQDLESQRPNPLDNLHSIGIDETSYRKGYKYITVIVNHETGEVVSILDGYGKEVLSKFFLSMTQQQRESIRVVTADGARWIAACVEDYLPNAQRCVDSYHVVEWSMTALDQERLDAAHRAQRCLSNQLRQLNGLEPEEDRERNKLQRQCQQTEQLVKSVKGAKYPIGKAPEHLTEKQKTILAALQEGDPKLFRAYRLKEDLRNLLKMTDAKAAADLLQRWYWRASHSRLPAFTELAKKIKRHMPAILNTIATHLSNARIEATNNKIKVVLRRSYGFRNMENMAALLLLVCSDLQPQLPNRPLPAQTT